MTTTSSLFAGLKSAKTSERGIWLREGNYLVRPKRALYKVTRKSGDAFILEFSIEQSNYDTVKKGVLASLASHPNPPSMQEIEKLLPNQVGTSAAWYQSLKDIDIGFGALKSFAANILGVKPEEPEFVEAVEGFMASVVNEGAINGMLIPVDVIIVQTKQDKDFSLHKWGKIVEETVAQ